MLFDPRLLQQLLNAQMLNNAANQAQQQQGSGLPAPPPAAGGGQRTPQQMQQWFKSVVSGGRVPASAHPGTGAGAQQQGGGGSGGGMPVGPPAPPPSGGGGGNAFPTIPGPIGQTPLGAPIYPSPSQYGPFMNAMMNYIGYGQSISMPNLRYGAPLNMQQRQFVNWYNTTYRQEHKQQYDSLYMQLLKDYNEQVESAEAWNDLVTGKSPGGHHLSDLHDKEGSVWGLSPWGNIVARADKPARPPYDYEPPDFKDMPAPKYATMSPKWSKGQKPQPRSGPQPQWTNPSYLTKNGATASYQSSGNYAHNIAAYSSHQAMNGIDNTGSVLTDMLEDGASDFMYKTNKDWLSSWNVTGNQSNPGTLGQGTNKIKHKGVAAYDAIMLDLNDMIVEGKAGNIDPQLKAENSELIEDFEVLADSDGKPYLVLTGQSASYVDDGTGPDKSKKDLKARVIQQIAKRITKFFDANPGSIDKYIRTIDPNTHKNMDKSQVKSLVIEAMAGAIFTGAISDISKRPIINR